MSYLLNRLPRFLNINNKETLIDKNQKSDTQKPEPLQVLPTEEPVSLRELGDRFKIGFDKIHIPQGEYSFSKTLRDHDLLSHVLGGGITTPKGEVFGELMEFILSTLQEHSYNPNSNFEQPKVTMPSKFKFLLQVFTWEARYLLRGKLSLKEHLSPQEQDDIFNYGETLLTEYIRHWGVNAGEGLLGNAGYKKYPDIEEGRFDLTL